MTKAKPKDRVDLLRQIEKFGNPCRIISKRPDIANAETFRFRGNHKVLRIKGGIHRGNDELFRQPFGRRAAMRLAAAHWTAEIGTEDKELCRALDISLAACNLAKRGPFVRVGDTHDGHPLKEARACRRLTCLYQPGEQGRVDGFVGEFANGTVIGQQIDCRVHCGVRWLHSRPKWVADSALMHKSGNPPGSAAILAVPRRAVCR